MKFTPEQITRMAMEAEIGDSHGHIIRNELPHLMRFAALVAAAEREVCAKVCDELHWPWHMGDNSGPKECAAAIRARGQS